MKNHLILFATFSICFFSFKQISPKAAANVEQRQGIYVFVLSKPATDYQVLGTVKKGFSISGQPNELLDAQIKKVLKEFPQANGIIYSSLDMDRANVVRIKD
jgi:hypothetical protein